MSTALAPDPLGGASPVQRLGMPPLRTLHEAFRRRDASYEGVFFVAVQTTGIFCRPTCPARRPRPDHVRFLASSTEALAAGYRPCLRCRPMEPLGTPPPWLRPLLADVETDPSRRWRERDLRHRGLSPERVRRWFQSHHGMTFHAYTRARRLGHALGRIQHGDSVLDAALDHGWSSPSGFVEAFRKLAGTAPSRARSSRPLVVTRIPTPLGPMVAVATHDALCLLEFTDRRMLPAQLHTLVHRIDGTPAPGANAVLDRTARELGEYFAGKRRVFGVPLLAPGTPFQERVWEELRRIPFGKRVSYGHLAARIGRPAAVRAVARANGHNRIAILVPCHRVVGSDGKLTGYGGGLWRKQRLLELEEDHAARLRAAATAPRAPR